MSTTHPEPTHTCDKCGATVTGPYPDDWFCVNKGNRYLFGKTFDFCGVGCLRAWGPQQ